MGSDHAAKHAPTMSRDSPLWPSFTIMPDAWMAASMRATARLYADGRDCNTSSLDCHHSLPDARRSRTIVATWAVTTPGAGGASGHCVRLAARPGLVACTHAPGRCNRATFHSPAATCRCERLLRPLARLPQPGRRAGEATSCRADRETPYRQRNAATDTRQARPCTNRDLEAGAPVPGVCPRRRRRHRRQRARVADRRPVTLLRRGRGARRHALGNHLHAVHARRAPPLLVRIQGQSLCPDGGACVAAAIDAHRGASGRHTTQAELVPQPLVPLVTPRHSPDVRVKQRWRHSFLNHPARRRPGAA